MISGNLTSEEYTKLAQESIWQEIFSWIKKNGHTLPEGEHDIRTRDIYANLFSADTLPREQTTFEAHRKYIDLHYCLEGGENIEYLSAQDLTPSTDYDEQKDYQLFTHPLSPAISTLSMTPNTFALFYPNEAHMPKISDTKNTRVKKVVIKILASLLPS